MIKITGDSLLTKQLFWMLTVGKSMEKTKLQPEDVEFRLQVTSCPIRGTAHTWQTMGLAPRRRRSRPLHATGWRGPDNSAWGSDILSFLSWWLGRQFFLKNVSVSDIENRLMDMGRGEVRVRCMERVTWKLTLPYVKSTANRKLLYGSGNSNKGSVSTRGVRWGGRWEAGSKGRGYMYTYGWFMLRFDIKHQNSVKHLSFNKK